MRLLFAYGSVRSVVIVLLAPGQVLQVGVEGSIWL